MLLHSLSLEQRLERMVVAAVVPASRLAVEVVRAVEVVLGQGVQVQLHV